MYIFSGLTFLYGMDNWYAFPGGGEDRFSCSLIYIAMLVKFHSKLSVLWFLKYFCLLFWNDLES